LRDLERGHKTTTNNGPWTWTCSHPFFSCIGGSLGWQTKGNLDPDFEKVAFELAASTTDNPKYERVKTGFGYHIIMVEGRK